ncbi:tRNA (guanine-N(7)-)-methyltransferase non-catalytic subunit trm82, partial [Ascosphaera aggregata]
LSVPSWDHNSLISGGGDDFLLVWDWVENKIRQRIKLELNELHEDGQPLAGPVTGIWAISFAGHPIPLLREVATGALCVYLFGHDKTLIPQPPVSVSGNVLDLTVLNDAGVIMVSVDDTADSRAADSQQTLVQMFTPSFIAGSLEWTMLESPVADLIHSHGTFDILQSESAKERQEQRNRFNVEKRGWQQQQQTALSSLLKYNESGVQKVLVSIMSQINFCGHLDLTGEEGSNNGVKIKE